MTAFPDSGSPGASRAPRISPVVAGEYSPPIDGLRAAAVLAVVAFHSARPLLPGGFLGVDVFFVISGFVITLTLLREFGRSGRLALVAFYRRRFWRLMPALAAAVLLAAALTPWTRDDAASVLLQAAQATTYTLNLGHAVSSHPGDQVLSHTWSLGIEEQFYLCYAPVAGLLLAAAATRRARVASLVALLALLALAGVVTHRTAGAQVAFFMPWARFPELLVGAALALALDGRPSRFGRVLRHPAPALLAAVGLTLLMFTVEDLLNPLLPQGGFMLVALLAAVLVGHAYTADQGPLRRVLAWRASTWLGQRSYGLYLYHWPVVVALQHQDVPRVLHPPIVLIVGLALAAVSYRLLEQPMRRRGHRRARAAS